MNLFCAWLTVLLSNLVCTAGSIREMSGLQRWSLARPDLQEMGSPGH